MIVNTGEFRALSSQVEEQQEDVSVLVRLVAALSARQGRQPEVQETGPERPQLHLIRGGRS